MGQYIHGIGLDQELLIKIKVDTHPHHHDHDHDNDDYAPKLVIFSVTENGT